MSLLASARRLPHNGGMATQSLVLSRDPYVLSTLAPLMRELDMAAEFCAELPAALEKLKSRSFDAVIVDCEEREFGMNALARVREEATTRPVTVGIVRDNTEMNSAFERGATFVLSKPLPLEDARRILKITKGSLTRAVRRFLRLPVPDICCATLDGKHQAIILNVSKGGIAVQTSEPLFFGQMVYASFALPGGGMQLENMAQVMWTEEDTCRAGIEFRTLTGEMQQSLNEWIMRQSIREEEWPEFAPVEAAREAPQLARHAAHGFGALLDMGFVAMATLICMLPLALFARGHAAWKLWSAALASGVLLWVMYRALFWTVQEASPGQRIAQNSRAKAR
jgi:CheY-like chemotaxis protein